MNFEGWLIKFGGVILPNNYLEQYKDKPNMRTEIDSYRETKSIKLHRTTSPYYKSQITLPIRSLYYGEKIMLKAILDAAMINEVERKISVDYWNSEEMGYKHGEFYIPNIEYMITHIDQNKLNIVYAPFDLTLIEY